MTNIFNNAKTVMFNNKEVKTITTENGGIIWKKEELPSILTATLTGSYIEMGHYMGVWLNTRGSVTINWGDGTTNIVNNPDDIITHNYNDGLSEHIVTFDGNVTGIKRYCFRQPLKSIFIPNSVTSLGEYCFGGCRNLTNITIPNSITSFGDNCFYGCSNLIDYQLYWEDSAIIQYNNTKMLNNTNTVFTIPVGQTANYVAKGYPSNKLVERS